MCCWTSRLYCGLYQLFCNILCNLHIFAINPHLRDISDASFYMIFWTAAKYILHQIMSNGYDVVIKASLLKINFCEADYMFVERVRTLWRMLVYVNNGQKFVAWRKSRFITFHLYWLCGGLIIQYNNQDINDKLFLFTPEPVNYSRACE